jgi:hypothetical protein
MVYIVSKIGFGHQMCQDNIVTLEVRDIYVDIHHKGPRAPEEVRRHWRSMRRSKDVGASTDQSRGHLAHVN